MAYPLGPHVLKENSFSVPPQPKIGRDHMEVTAERVRLSQVISAQPRLATMQQN